MLANAESAKSFATQQMSQIPVNMRGESAKVYIIEGKRAEPESSAEPAPGAAGSSRVGHGRDYRLNHRRGFIGIPIFIAAPSAS
jgi:hypothetical protein